MADQAVCTVDGCCKPVKVKSRGLCNTHYLRFRKYGRADGGGTLRGEPEAFYQSKILPCDDDECLIWPFARNESGYGRMFSRDGETTLVHRRACRDRNGSPPSDEHEAAHICGKGHEGCVNPRHLKWSTRIENMADMVGHGTSTKKPRGSTHPRAKLTESEVREIRATQGTAKRSDVASRFGVSEATVKAIYARRVWAWLD